MEWAVFGIGLIFGLGWVLVLTFTVGGHNSFWAARILPYERYFAIHNFLVVVLIFCVISGYRLSPKAYKVGEAFSVHHLKVDTGRLHVYGWAFLLIGVFLRWLYVSPYGGFVDYLDHSANIRSAIFEIDNKWSFLQPFGAVGVFSAFLFCASMLGERKTFGKVFGFLCSLSFSVYILYSLLGRVDFLIFISTFALALLCYKEVRPTIIVVGSVVGTGLMLVSAFVISDLLQIKSAGSLQGYVAQELSFPFVSFFAQLENGQYLYRFFQDLILAPLYLLPSSLWGQWVDNVSQINTLVVMGARKGDGGVTGGIPVDILTLGLMQMSVVGVVGVGLIFGFLLSFFQGFIDGIESGGLRAFMLAYLAIRVSVFAIAYAHPLHFVSSIFGVLFTIGFFFSVSFLRRLRIYR